MLSKQDRRTLISKAQLIEPLVIIGKNGLTENVLVQIEDLLDARELVKLSVLRNCTDTPLALGTEAADKIGAEVVTHIGQKVVLYKLSTRKDIVHVL